MTPLVALLLLSGPLLGHTVDAGLEPGIDLGQQINAADQKLGAGPGRIVVNSDQLPCLTPIHISNSHILDLAPGVYDGRCPVETEWQAEIVGSGINTVWKASGRFDAF